MKNKSKWSIKDKINEAYLQIEKNSKNNLDAKSNLKDPKSLATLKIGEYVLDLGCGVGFDSFIAAEEVGVTGRVIGIDVTEEVIAKAIKNYSHIKFNNIEFKIAQIDNLPVSDNYIDIVLSNCIINLFPDKLKVYKEVFRVLKNGGRIAISDIVALNKLPESLKQNMKFIFKCISGAVEVETITEMLKQAGFINIDISLDAASRELIKGWQPGGNLDEYLCSASIIAFKPKTAA